MCIKGAFRSKFFTYDQNAGKGSKCILTKLELSTSCHFQDIAVQSQRISFYFSVGIYSRLTFRNGLNLFEKQLIYNSDPLPLTITLTHTFIESYEQVETF